ncbi:unnamed protein product [Dovyalis caffra]|uniref:Uncharacterized protein n=1 Tax=Dovyalis caffra TaxID=77055 RepID=A0AAV1R1G1_9ROSI|nr:unnamed protein product [Dovyalis caffra]
MAAWTTVARQASNLTCFSSTKIASPHQAASLVHRRGLASGGDHHGSPKVNFWEDPLTPSKWKEEQFVTVSLAGCGTLIYVGYKFFTGGKNDKKEESTALQMNSEQMEEPYTPVVPTYDVSKTWLSPENG